MEKSVVFVYKNEAIIAILRSVLCMTMCSVTARFWASNKHTRIRIELPQTKKSKEATAKAQAQLPCIAGVFDLCTNACESAIPRWIYISFDLVSFWAYCLVSSWNFHCASFCFMGFHSTMGYAHGDKLCETRSCDFNFLYVCVCSLSTKFSNRL